MKKKCDIEGRGLKKAIFTVTSFVVDPLHANYVTKCLGIGSMDP
jgi:hypothetical protein